MTSPFPGYFAWPLYAAMLLVIIARGRLIDKTFIERCFTLSLVFMLLTSLLREHLVQNLLASGALLTVAASRQIGTCGISFASAEYLAFVNSWAGVPDREVERRITYYRATAIVCSALMLILGTEARRRDTVIEATGGWAGFCYWVVFAVLPLSVAWGLARMAVDELRQDEGQRRERIIAALLGLEALIIGASTMLAVVMAFGDAAGLTDTVAYRLYSHPRYFFVINVIVTCVTSSTVVRALWAHLGMDGTSRRWRKLHPLWGDLVKAFPTIKYKDAAALRQSGSSRQISPLQLQRTVVEIRDGIMRAQDMTGPLPLQISDQFVESLGIASDDARDAALALHTAIGIRIAMSEHSANAPGYTETTDTISTATNLEEETLELLRLSKYWAAAKNVAASIEHLIQPTMTAETRKRD